MNMTDFPKTLASNRFFDEYVLLDPVNFERMKQRGGGKLDYNEAFDERLFVEPRNDMVPDDDPRIERMKTQYLLSHNDRDTVLQFSRMRQLQKRLDQHLTQGQPLPSGFSLYNITEAIRKIKTSYRDKFARMLGKATTTRIIDQSVVTPAGTQSSTGVDKNKKKKKKTKKPKAGSSDSTKITQLDDTSRPSYITPSTWSSMSDEVKKILLRSNTETPSSLALQDDSDASGDGGDSSGSNSSSSADTSSTDGSDPDTVSDKSDDDGSEGDDHISPLPASFGQGVGASSTPKSGAKRKTTKKTAPLKKKKKTKDSGYDSKSLSTPAAPIFKGSKKWGNVN